MATRHIDERKASRERASQPAESQPLAATPRSEVSDETRYVMIQEAAYLRAERRGFEPGFELEDWVAAENEIDTLLGATSSSRPPQ